MQVENVVSSTGVDFFNYHAIAILELLGRLDPDQLEIDIIERHLQTIYNDKALASNH